MFLCLGMYSSASTWAFNVVRQIAKSALPGKSVLAAFVPDTIPDFDAATTVLVAKNHGTGVARDIGLEATGIVLTVRDPRDAIASLMRHNKAPFDLALQVTERSAAACAWFAGHPRSVLLKFEDRFFDAPETVERIARLFPALLAAGEAERIFAGLRREAVEAFIAGMRGTTEFDALTGQSDTFDPETGWHRHHTGRTAEVGRWQGELTKAQVRSIEQRMRRPMATFSYAPS